MTPIVELAEVSRRYAGAASVQAPVLALSDVTLQIGAGELVAVVGASGSGKSTLLHVLGTLDRPTAGRVRLGGVDVAELGDRQLSEQRALHLGFVFQRFFLLPGLTAVENVATALLYRGTPRAERAPRARAALERVGLAQRAGHRPHELSGGEQQRVALARALVGSPRLVLADEPTGNLDTASGDLVLDQLCGLADEGTAVVIVTHDARVAARCDRRVTMRDGRVVDDEIGRR